MAHYVEMFQVRYKSVLKYHLDLDSGSYRRSNLTLNFRDKTTYSGEMTVHARKRITRAVNLLLMISPDRIIWNPVIGNMMPFKISFITLTIPNAKDETDHRTVITKCLPQFLKWCRDKHKMKHYVWKAELQKNGSIHIHITTNVFIHYKEIRDKWNKTIAAHHYLDTYYSEHGNVDANSTDVHSVRNVKDIESYLIKYIGKNDEEGRRIFGKVWDCSLSLKRNKYFTEHFDPKFWEIYNRIRKQKNCKVFTDFENYEMLITTKENIDAILDISEDTRTEYLRWMKGVQEYSRA